MAVFPTDSGLKRHYSQVQKCGKTWKASIRKLVIAQKPGEPPVEPSSPPDVSVQDVDLDDVWDVPAGGPDFIEGSSSGLPRVIDNLPSRSNSLEPSARVRTDSTMLQEFPSEYEAGKRRGTRQTCWERMRDDRVSGHKDRWGGFEDQEQWELACWMMKSGLSQGEIDKFLKLSITQNKTRPIFHNKCAFFQLIDDLPTSRIPEFDCEIIEVEGTQVDENGNKRVEHLELWRWDPIACIQEIIGNPALRDHISYAPVKLFTDDKWWWDVQFELPKGSTVVPVILASDATRLSNFGGDKTAWPVYITIGNVDKGIRHQPNRRATILLGYLPTSKLESKFLPPLREAGLNGVEMTCADGYVRRVHPILAAYVADFPEQCLVTCTMESCCPRCKVATGKRGKYKVSEPRREPNILDILEAEYQNKHSTAKVDGVRTDVYAPFWAELPYTNIFSCITPDLLHQLHKGVFKDHLLDWCSTLAGAEELDQRIQTMTTHAGLRQFKRGISLLKQWTGTEAKHLEKVFLGALAGAVDAEAFRAARAIIDFIYYAQFSSHSTKTLQYMQDELIEFHKYKHIFKKHKIREHFNIPKLHSMLHYVSSIWTHGTLDGYNTELPEQLHINLAKEGYRASNQRNYVQQIIKWLRCQESIDAYTAFLSWVMPDYQAIDLEEEDEEEEEELETEEDLSLPVDEQSDDDDEALPCPEGSTSWFGHTVHTLAKWVPHPSMSVQTLIERHAATNFIPSLRIFMQQYHPSCQIQPGEADTFNVYKHIKLQYKSLQGFGEPPEKDTIRATPIKPPVRAGRLLTPAYFDTALVDREGLAEATGIEGVDVVQIRVIFKLPPEFEYPHALAYVEYFTGRRILSDTYSMWSVRRAMQEGKRKAGIIRLDTIRSACQLFPRFGHACPSSWTSSNILEVCESFYMSPYLSKYFFNALSVPTSILQGLPNGLEYNTDSDTDSDMDTDDG
ncbi:hypothetical protein M422DRAFT_266567 [Sphaerobolus stellatus SS14]|uniref:Uncharacterized protein n=1 Tax=Sphaerobolus stellatus (strain SS14) TaxID=990650 RepID=A0A0C9UR70_SPHS4|nr:hypothetical protein M422DRAFT_266567 [Sphaerobolus stellatus SS14]